MPDAYVEWVEEWQNEPHWSDQTHGSSAPAYNPTPSFQQSPETAQPFAPGEDIGIWDPTLSVGLPGDPWGSPFPGFFIPTPTFVPQVVVESAPGGSDTVQRPSPTTVVDEGAQPAYGEDAYDQSTWDEFYEAYEELNRGETSYDPYEPDDEGVPVVANIYDAIIAGIDLFDDDVQQIITPVTTAYSAGFAPTTPGAVGQPGSTVQIDPKTGKIKCKRRRRRRLLTESDFNDLMRIATLPNKQNVTVSLAKAIGRSR